jgi:hypothetical protein
MSANNRQHYCSAASLCSAAHPQLAARTTRTSGPASTLFSRTFAILTRTTTAPTSPRRHPHHFPLLLPFHTDFCFSGQSWPTMVGFLSQISSLSAPGPTGPTGPLTAVTSPSGQAISPRFGWAHRTIPAVRVSPLPCFRPRIDGHRLLRSPLMSSRPRAETLLLAQLQSTISRP